MSQDITGHDMQSLNRFMPSLTMVEDAGMPLATYKRSQLKLAPTRWQATKAMCSARQGVVHLLCMPVAVFDQDVVEDCKVLLFIQVLLMPPTLDHPESQQVACRP